MATKKKPTRNDKRLAKKAAAKKSRKPKKPVEIKRKPRAQRLPGMEDAGIMELENLANDVADATAQKKECGVQEKNLNEQLVTAMKKHGKTSYSHRGIYINLSTTDKAKVAIKEDVDDTPADNEPVETVLGQDSAVLHSED